MNDRFNVLYYNTITTFQSVYCVSDFHSRRLMSYLFGPLLRQRLNKMLCR